jgi:hypothetical protein
MKRTYNQMQYEIYEQQRQQQKPKHHHQPKQQEQKFLHQKQQVFV